MVTLALFFCNFTHGLFGLHGDQIVDWVR